MASDTDVQQTVSVQEGAPSAAAPRAAAPTRPPARYGGRSDQRDRGERDRGDRDDRGPRRGRRRRVCIMCAEHMKFVDYKDVGFVRRYVSDRARIETRRKSSSCAKHQRALARAIKRARHLALIPYTPEHMRLTGYRR
jgi:small subunit ribosomal protein S18